MIWSPRWFPGTNLQDINLDWILKKVSALRGGSTGQYLYKKSDKDFDFGWKTGGGGGGTSDYLDLDNKPSINNIELIGNKTASDLGLASAADIPVVPVQSVNGMTGAVVLSASDLGAYVKPATGIPKTDLSSAVQESLDKADSAYVKPVTGIPKTDLSSAVQESLDKADSAYVKPVTGIPKTDLSSAVQTSLDKADTALQAVPPTYRTAAAQDTIDAAQNAQIDARAKAGEVGIVITGARPSIAVNAGQYVIVRNSTISGIADGLYTANSALSPSTDVTAANLMAVSNGGLNSLSALIDAKHVAVWPTPTKYNSVQDVVDVMSDLPTNSFLLNTFGSDLRTDLFDTASSYDGFIVCFKASGNNIYYFAFSRDVAGIGNINIPNVNVSIKHSLL